MITKEMLSELRKDCDRAIEEVGHKYSLSIDLKGISYSDTNASGKIEMSLIQSDGVLQTRERSSWQSMASTYGLDPDLLDKTFVSNGVAHTVAGINMKAKKYPIQTRDPQGKGYKWPLSHFKRAIEQAEMV